MPIRTWFSWNCGARATRRRQPSAPNVPRSSPSQSSSPDSGTRNPASRAASVDLPPPDGSPESRCRASGLYFAGATASTREQDASLADSVGRAATSRRTWARALPCPSALTRPEPQAQSGLATPRNPTGGRSSCPGAGLHPWAWMDQALRACALLWFMLAPALMPVLTFRPPCASLWLGSWMPPALMPVLTLTRTGT